MACQGRFFHRPTSRAAFFELTRSSGTESILPFKSAQLVSSCQLIYSCPFLQLEDQTCGFPAGSSSRTLLLPLHPWPSEQMFRRSPKTETRLLQRNGSKSKS